MKSDSDLGAPASPSGSTLQPPAGASAAIPGAKTLTDEQIDRIAENCAKSMPDGIRGFCRLWGWRQFARELLDVCAGYRRAVPSDEELERDALRYRWLRDAPATRQDDRGVRQWLFARPGGSETMDAAIDAALARAIVTREGGDAAAAPSPKAIERGPQDAP